MQNIKYTFCQSDFWTWCHSLLLLIQHDNLANWSAHCCVRMKIVEILGVLKFLSRKVMLTHMANYIFTWQQCGTCNRHLKCEHASRFIMLLCCVMPSLDSKIWLHHVTFVMLKHSILCIFCPIALYALKFHRRLVISVVIMCTSFGKITYSNNWTRSNLNRIFPTIR